MTQSPHDAARERAHALILKGLKAYSGSSTPESLPFLNKPISVNEYHEKLTQSQIIDAAVAFVIATNMQAGSDMNEGFDLYNLLQAYILEPEKRAQINEVVKR
jgi:hypothetical protein